MATVIEHTNIKWRVTETSKIVVTDPEESDGQQVRALRIYGSAGSDAPPVIEIVVLSADLENIKLKTPELKF